jgi:hypothetical protein
VDSGTPWGGVESSECDIVHLHLVKKKNRGEEEKVKSIFGRRVEYEIQNRHLFGYLGPSRRP